MVLLPSLVQSADGMDRLFAFWRKYTGIPNPAKRYIQRHAQITEFHAGDYFMQPGDRMPYWCIVLKGLANGYTIDADGRQHIHWFALPNQGFTGTRHLYTQQPQLHYIQFLQSTSLLMISSLKAREGKELFPAMSELIHVMKQHFIDNTNTLVEVLHETDINRRYAAFVEKFPEIERLTTRAQQKAFINMANGSFYRAKNHYLRSNRS